MSTEAKPTVISIPQSRPRHNRLINNNIVFTTHSPNAPQRNSQRRANLCNRSTFNPQAILTALSGLHYHLPIRRQLRPFTHQRLEHQHNRRPPSCILISPWTPLHQYPHPPVQIDSSPKNTILQALISETTAAHGAPTYKFAVTSTIIQHTIPLRSYPVNSEHEGGQTGADTMIGRRGMHSATGAFWNNEKDGMWSFKYEGGEGKGFDVVVSVVWIGIVWCIGRGWEGVCKRRPMEVSAVERRHVPMFTWSSKARTRLKGLCAWHAVPESLAPRLCAWRHRLQRRLWHNLEYASAGNWYARLPQPRVISLLNTPSLKEREWGYLSTLTVTMQIDYLTRASCEGFLSSALIRVQKSSFLSARLIFIKFTVPTSSSSSILPSSYGKSLVCRSRRLQATTTVVRSTLIFPRVLRARAARCNPAEGVKTKNSRSWIVDLLTLQINDQQTSDPPLPIPAGSEGDVTVRLQGRKVEVNRQISQQSSFLRRTYRCRNIFLTPCASTWNRCRSFGVISFWGAIARVVCEEIDESGDWHQKKLRVKDTNSCKKRSATIFAGPGPTDG